MILLAMSYKFGARDSGHDFRLFYLLLALGVISSRFVQDGFVALCPRCNFWGMVILGLVLFCCSLGVIKGKLSKKS